MTLSDYGIREWKPGERAILDYHPYEFECECGFIPLTHEEPHREEVEIVSMFVDAYHCSRCYKEHTGEGYIKVLSEGKYHIVVPWPLLSPIPEGEEDEES